MADNDFNKVLKKAIFIAGALDKAVRISRFMNDMADGIEEIEKSINLAKQDHIVQEYIFTDKKRKKPI